MIPSFIGYLVEIFEDNLASCLGQISRPIQIKIFDQISNERWNHCTYF